MLKRFLLSTVAYAPPGEGDPGNPPADDQDAPADDEAPPADGDEPPADDAPPADDEAPEDGEPTDDDDELPADDEQPAAARGNRAIGALRADRRRLAEDNARLTRELDDARRRPAAPAAPVETPQQRADRLALMSPSEQANEIVTEALARNEAKTNAVMFQLMDRNDKTQFDALAARDPVARKLADEVERELAGLRQRGQGDLPRETIYTFLLGKRARASMDKAKPGADQRRRQQQTRPANGRGDVAQPRQQRRGNNSVSDIERDFGDVPI